MDTKTQAEEAARAKKLAGLDQTGNFAYDEPKLPRQTKVTEAGRDRLQEMCGLMGYVNVKGRLQGQGSISQMIEEAGRNPHDFRQRLRSAMPAIAKLEPLQWQRLPRKGQHSGRVPDFGDRKKRLQLTVTETGWQKFSELCLKLGYGSIAGFVDEVARDPMGLLEKLAEEKV
jgi:hypothetical protein